MNNFNESLKDHRIEAGMTLQYVEKNTGISNQNLSRWENGQAIPGINFCIKLAQFYGCTLDELVGIDSDTHNSGKTTLPEQPQKAVSAFDKEFSEILSDNNFIQTAKLFRAITPELRALALGYIVGLLQSNNVNTRAILGY